MVQAQEAADLAKKLPNPIADLVSVTVPVNLTFSKLLSFGPLPASYLIGAGVFPVSPETGPDWKIRSAITILLPRKR